MILGGVRGPLLGLFVLFGEGGVELESRRDTVFGYAPLDTLAAEHLLRYTNSEQRVSECRRVKLCVAAAPPSGGHAHLLLTSRRPLT